jgi:2-methylisocitrate lyase-like PEP mutase family enzyme
MNQKTLRQLLAQDKPLLLPCAHDALSARLIAQAGFEAYSIGGFGLVASRLGIPDLGLAGFGEISAGVRDIIAANKSPVIVDGDDGYGDAKNVTRTVRTYEAMGVHGLILEDQTNPKRCGHMGGKTVVSRDTAERKLQAALAARQSAEFFIIARTDARAVLGMDEAIARGERFLALGADALFIEAPVSIEELKTIGSHFCAPLVVNAAEAGRTPVLSPAEYARMGFSIVAYPSSILLRVVSGIRAGIEAIRRGQMAEEPDIGKLDDLTQILGISDWMDIDDRFGAAIVPGASKSNA